MITNDEIEKAALKYAQNMSEAPDKCTPNWIQADFKAGVKWAIAKLNKHDVSNSVVKYKCLNEQQYCSCKKDGYCDNKDVCKWKDN